MWHRVLTIGAVIVAGLAAPAIGAALAIPDATAQVYPDPGPRPLPAGFTHPPVRLDPSRPTVAIVLATDGANVADTMGPYEVFARSGRYNVVTVAPTTAPVPLTGGLDILPDLSFDELAARLPKPPEVIVVPQLRGDTTTVQTWLRAQHEAGAPLIMGVCVGPSVLADAGLLTHRRATAHWLKLIQLRRTNPDVDWVEGVRFVESGPGLITTAGVLSGIDGSLRIIERTVGPAEATAIANQLHWKGYRPGRTTAIPAAKLAPPDLAGLLNAGYRWDRPTDAVLVTPGVGELELAAAFRPYTELAYLARLRAVSRDGRPVRSLHGVTFLPRAGWEPGGGARLLVPGVRAAATKAAHDLPGAHDVTYLQHPRDDEFPFDATLRDIARTYDSASAAWVAKCLQYALPRLEPGSAGWPWAPTARFGLLAAGGVGLALGVRALIGVQARARARRARTDAAGDDR